MNVFILVTDVVSSTVKKNEDLHPPHPASTVIQTTSSCDCAAVAGPSLAKWISRGDRLSYKQSQEFWSSIIE